MNKKIKEREKMKRKMYHRFDIYDKIWKKMAPHLSRQREQHGGIAKDNRNFINAVMLYGYEEQGHHGGICRMVMENGGQCIKDLLDGKKMVFRRNYLRYLKVIKNLNG